MEGRRLFPGRSRRNRLRRTHLNGNRGFRNAFLMRLSPWETVPRAADARPRAQTPKFVGSSDHLRVLTALRPDAPLRCANGLRSVAGGADRRDDPPGRALVARNAPEELSRCVRPPPGESKLDLCSGSEGFRGAFASAKAGGAASLALALRSLPRGLGKERERCSLAARRAARLCCAEAGG